MKKLTARVLSLAAALSLTVSALAAEGFSDVPASHTFHDAIMDCASKGITSGYSDGTFRPGNSVTRAQFCVMLARAFYPDLLKTYDYARSTAWYMPAMMALNVECVLTNTSFSGSYSKSGVMDNPISRLDMAQLMSNIMADKGFSADADQKAEAQTKIGDFKAIPGKYQDAVANVFSLKIINGYPDGSFGGENVMTRGSSCVTIYRMTQYTPAASTDIGAGNEDLKNTGTLISDSSNLGSGTMAPGTLTNGKPITEANVSDMLKELKSRYPDKTIAFIEYAAGYTSPVRTVTNQYARYSDGSLRTSTTRGCGGWTTFVCDSVFGDHANYRKTASNCARPGDICIHLENGKLTHVAVILAQATNEARSEYYKNYGCYPVGELFTTDGGEVDGQTIVDWAGQARHDDVEIWTCYPTDGTPVTIEPDTSSSTGGSSIGSPTSGNDVPTSTSTGISVPDNPVCSRCGKTSKTGVWKNNFTVFVCTECNNNG